MQKPLKGDIFLEGKILSRDGDSYRGSKVKTFLALSALSVRQALSQKKLLESTLIPSIKGDLVTKTSLVKSSMRMTRLRWTLESTMS